MERPRLHQAATWSDAGQMSASLCTCGGEDSGERLSTGSDSMTRINERFFVSSGYLRIPSRDSLLVARDRVRKVACYEGRDRRRGYFIGGGLPVVERSG